MKAVKTSLSLFWLALCLFLPVAALAQSVTATLNGLVTDTTGAALPGATVVLTSTTQSRRYHLTTNASGQFTFPLLQPDSYKLLVSHPGFQPLQVLSVPLHVDDVKTLQVKMHVGLVKDAVNVNADVDIVNTSSQVATTIDKNFVQEIPLNGRSFQSLLLLSPGVVAAPLVSNGIGQFSVNGQRTDSNYFTVDGVSVNNGTVPGTSGLSSGKYLAGTLPALNALGTTSSMISVDALDQFTLVTSSATAESGRQSGAQVQLASRAGSNLYHGTAFDFLRNEFFDARNFFLRTCNTSGVCTTNKKAKSRQNDFGGSFSGPVRVPFLYNGVDKTFFFFSYEGQRLQLPSYVNANTYVPSVSFRAQAQAAGSNAAAFLNALPVPNGALDTSGNWAIFTGTYTTPYNTNATSVRVDQNVGDKLHLFARYFYSPSSSTGRNLSVLTSTQQQALGGTLGATYTFTPRLVNEVTVNYTRNTGASVAYFDDFGGATPVSVIALTAPYAGTASRFAQYSLSYNSHSSAFGVGNTNTTLQRQSQITDRVSYTLGKHNLSAGVDVRLLAPVYQPIGFQVNYSFYSAPLLLANTLSNYTLTSTQEEHIHFHYFSLFAQDSWRPSKRLSLDYGIRWDLDPPPTEESGRRPASVIIPDPNNLATMRLSTASDPSYKTSLGAVAPRLGAAYVVHDGPGAQTVVRGGIGLFFSPNNDLAASGFSSFPFTTTQSNYAAGTPYPLPATLALAPPVATLTLPVRTTLPALEPNLDLPYNMQWNLTLQQALHGQTLSIAYVGSTAQRLLTTQQLNGAAPYTAANPSPQAPNPNFSYIQYTYNQPTSNFHSLQVQFIRPLSKGLQVLGNYTWSHAIDTVSNDFAVGTLDRSDADFDVRHSATAALVYATPGVRRTSGFGNAVLRGAANDWHLALFAIAHTGTPGNVTAGNYVGSNGLQSAARPDRVLSQPLWISAPGQAGGKRVNPAAFSLPPLYPGVPSYDTTDFARQGTLPRNAIELPGLYQFNTSVSRRVALTERVNLQLRVETYNVANHPNFGYYNLAWGPTVGSSFGLPSQMASAALNGTNTLYNLGGPRSIQLSAKLQF